MEPLWNDYKWLEASAQDYRNLESRAAALLSQQIGAEVPAEEVKSTSRGVYGAIRLTYALPRADGLYDLWVGARERDMIRWGENPQLVAKNCATSCEAVANYLGVDVNSVYCSVWGAGMFAYLPGPYRKRHQVAVGGRESDGPRPGWINDGWAYFCKEFLRR